MNEKEEIIKKIERENRIWIIYLGIIALSFYANYLEKQYYETGNETDKNSYRQIIIVVFSIALIIYIYFFKDSLQDVEKLTEWDSHDKKLFNQANLVATSLILCAGIILLWIAIFDKNLTTEIAFS